MKQRIRLTESTLHRIIKESVKQCLTELDWRTYQNASRKANYNAWKNYDDEDTFDKEMLRREKFAKAAEKAFDRQYPRHKGELSHTSDAMGYGGNETKFNDFWGGIEFSSNGEGCDFIHDDRPLPKRGGVPSKPREDVVNYADGHTKYKHNKGWD